MNTFEYLAVLISIVLGLGITNVLGGFAAMVRHRDRIRLYWPLLVWMVMLFLIHVQLWWAMFELRKVVEWNFGEFLAALMQPVVLYLTSAVLVPDFPEGDVIDLKKAYFREQRWFFGGIVALLIVSLVRTPIISGHMTNAVDLGAQLGFIALAVMAALWRNELFHKINAVVAIALYATYVMALFIRLS